MKKIILFTVLLILSMGKYTPAQETRHVPAGWSIDISGGATIGQFSFGSDMTPHAEIGFRYSLNPVVFLHGTAGGGEFRSSDYNWGDTTYENRYFTYGFGVGMNVLRMIAGPGSLTNRVGLHGRTGLGVIVNDVEISGSLPAGYAGQNYIGNTLLYRMGGDLTFRLSRRLDFFLRGDVNYSNSDLLDGLERETGTPVKSFLVSGDAFINTSAGFTIKLGSSEVRHARWYQGDHRIDPLAQSMEQHLHQIQLEMEAINTSMDTQHDSVQMLERSLDDINHLVNTVHSDQLMTQYNQIESLQTRFQLLQSELDELTEQVSEQYAAEQSEERTNQYFVVAGVFRNLENAEDQLRELREQGYDDAEIIRDRNRSYYLVNYSGHINEEAATDQLNRIRSEENPEAWIYVK